MEVMLQEKDNFKRFEGGRNSTETCAGKQANRQTDRQTGRQAYVIAKRHLQRKCGTEELNRQTERQVQTGRQAKRQTDR